MAKVVVMVDKMIVRVTLALVMTVDVWTKEQVAQAGRVYLLLGMSKGHICINWTLLHYGESTTTRNLLSIKLIKHSLCNGTESQPWTYSLTCHLHIYDKPGACLVPSVFATLCELKPSLSPQTTR